MKVITYYKKYTGNSKSIVDALKERKISSSFANRKKIAELNGIKNYEGTARQNTKLLNLFKKGKLIKKVTVKVVKTNAQKFVEYLKEIDKTFNRYGSHIVYNYNKAPKTYAEAKKKLEAGKTIGSTCIVPTKWGIKLLGMDSDGFYCKNGKFVGFNSGMKKKLTKISGKGYTIKQAVDKRYLKAGDICIYKNREHTFSYTGQGYLFFDGGHAAMKNGKYTGIIVNYNTNYYKDFKLAYILRWK